MLVLTRKVGEEVVIGGGIVIMVVQIRGDSVRLGIDAPKATPVHRREVWDAIAKSVFPAPCFLTDEDNPVKGVREEPQEGE